MKFALLSADSTAISLAQTIASAPDHSVIAAYGCQPFASEVNQLGVPRTQQFSLDDWDRLQHEPDCSAVIIGKSASEEERAEHLRKLAQSGLPMVVVHPIADMLLSFELQMIQRDSRSPIIPFFPGISSRLNCSLQQLCSSDQSDFGSIQQITIERDAKDGSPDSVRAAFARDAFLCRRWIGKIDRISALGSKPYPATDWKNLSVHMTAANGTIIRWTASPIPGSGEISVTSDRGRVACHNDYESGEWRLAEETSSALLPEPSEESPDSDAALICDALRKFKTDSTLANELWEDACRAIELADTIDHSYRRGKTIELYHEEHTEEETFKSMMAAGGCLAMLMTLFIIPLFAMLESLQIPWLEGEIWQRMPLRLLYWRNWPYYLFGALALFLLLQFLRLVFRSETNDNQPESRR